VAATVMPKALPLSWAGKMEVKRAVLVPYIMADPIP